MPKFTIGDEVRILKHRSRHDQFPEDGYVGKVTKVGRKYATAAYEAVSRYFSGEERQDERTIEFDMETGRDRGVTTNYGYYVRTPEMFERDRRMSEAKAVLRDAGLEVRMGYDRNFTLERLEDLAEVVKTWEERREIDDLSPE